MHARECKTLWNIHTVDYYADKMRGEVLVNAISQINPENNYANPQKLCYTNNKNNQSRTMATTCR